MKGFVAAVIAASLFGIGGTFGQFLFTHRGVNLEWLVTMRLLGAGVILLGLTLARKGRAALAIWRGGDAVQLLLFGIFGMLAVQYTYFAAIRFSNTATATVLQFTGPSMIAVWLALRQRHLPALREAIAILLALAGTFVLVTHGDFGALSISPLALFWGLASAVAAAFNSLQPVGLLRRHPASEVTGWGMIIGGIALSLLHAPWKVEGQWDGLAYLFLGFIVTFGTLVAFYLYLKAVRLIGAQKTSLLSSAEPLTAAVLAVWWLGVSFGIMDWLGSALIVATIFLLARKDVRQPEKVT
jgi:drug/metabolite transporter (DMT)-like permease